MQSAVSSVAYPNIMPWSPAPTSRSSFPTWTPPAMSGLCLLIRRNLACFVAQTFAVHTAQVILERVEADLLYHST